MVIVSKQQRVAHALSSDISGKDSKVGSIFAQDLADSEITIEQQVMIHLRSNHYPPVPTEMVEPCIEAISLSNQGDSGALVDLPEGITWKGQVQAPAYAIVEAHHLEPWIEYDFD